jgi:hypothetical protein
VSVASIAGKPKIANRRSQRGICAGLVNPFWLICLQTIEARDGWTGPPAQLLSLSFVGASLLHTPLLLRLSARRLVLELLPFARRFVIWPVDHVTGGEEGEHWSGLNLADRVRLPKSLASGEWVGWCRPLTLSCI